MKGDRIKFYRGYKYQLADDYEVRIPITGHTVFHEYFTLTADGTLIVRAGYAWDGASGPCIDTKTVLRGSLVHDVLYQMMRKGCLPQGCFHAANEILREMCKEDGMWSLRAKWIFDAVEDFGSAFAAIQPERVYAAP